MNIIENLSRKEDLICGKGASDKSIFDAEKALNLTFSKEYRDYLRTYSCVMYEGHELTGISKFSRIHVVDVTIELKRNEKMIPEDWYVIEETGIDGIVIWQDVKGTVYRNQKKSARLWQSMLKSFRNVI